MAEDYGVALKITADTSDLDNVEKQVDKTQQKIEQPVEQPIEVKVKQPEPVTVKVSQDPDPLKIKVALPDPSEIEAAIPKKDFHVDVQPQLDPSKLQAIPPINIPSNPVKPKVDPSDAVNGFNALKAATDVLHGNIAGLAMEISKLSKGAGLLKTIGVSGFLAIGGAIMGVVSLARSLRDLFSTMFNTNIVGRDISSLGASLVDIKNEAENFASAMDDARKAADLVNQSLEKEISALGRVAKAQSEINRQRELAAASSDDERADINSRYDRQAIDIGANTAQQSDEAKRKSIEDEIERLKKEIEQSDATIAAYNQTAASARRRADFHLGPNAGTVFGGMVDTADSIVSGIANTKTDREKAEAALAVTTNAQNAADDEIERQAELKERLEQKLHELKMADLDAEARKAEQEANKAKVKADEAVRAKQREERLQDEQDKFERERGKSAADAEFEDRMRAEQRKASAPNATEADRSAAENAQIAMLREREDAARKELSDVQARLDAELKKPAAVRDEKAMSRAREDISAADSGAPRLGAGFQVFAPTARAGGGRVAQDYFGNLARQIDASRPRGRLQQMGLMGTDRATADIQRKISGDLQRAVELIREQLSLARAESYKNNTSTYAP